MKKIVGLCKARHIIPVETYIFPENFFAIEGSIFEWQYMDRQVGIVLEGATEVDLYVTGLTPALTVVINWCFRNNVKLTLFHYDRASEGYIRQEMFV